MKCFFDPRQQAHHPKHFLVAGVQRPSPEVPERADILLRAAKASGAEISQPGDAGLEPISTVHSSAYLGFLRTIHQRWMRLDGAAPEVVPNIHPTNRNDTYPASPVGQAGFHQADTACPIGANTYEAAYASAQCAIAAADEVMRGARCAYALCRPPGHHAFADMAGGFCFLNNSAIAAQRYAAKGWRVAVLDVDVHHGNGTQGIFYETADVLTVSIHTDPNGFYPFFWGHAHETGEGAGRDANFNVPLPKGADDTTFMVALNMALTRIADFGAQVIIVALGLDAHESDPFQGMSLSTGAFTKIARTIAGTGLPLVLVQEGGYVSDELGQNLSAFFAGL